MSTASPDTPPNDTRAPKESTTSKEGVPSLADLEKIFHTIRAQALRDIDPPKDLHS
jgi:hypothetical protein